MTFAENLADDVTNVFLNTTEFAETISYTPSGGQAADISAQVLREDIEPDYGDDGRVRRRSARVFISTADVASPGEQDTLVFDSLTWAVERVERVEGGMAELLVRRVEHVERSGEAHRIRR